MDALRGADKAFGGDAHAAFSLQEDVGYCGELSSISSTTKADNVWIHGRPKLTQIAGACYVSRPDKIDYTPPAITAAQAFAPNTRVKLLLDDFIGSRSHGCSC